MNMWEFCSTASDVGTKKHPRSHEKFIQYGTAGFRTRAEYLDHVLFRMGLLAVLRSKIKRATIGVMITASHNPEPDNGVKLVDPQGEMLEQKWEELATGLANAANENVEKILLDIIETHKIDINSPASVYIGQDTRPSSSSLARAVCDGVMALGGIVEDWGIVTTPMLHYFVALKNTGQAPCKEDYFNKLVGNFRLLRNQNSVKGNYVPHIFLDGANGVGAQVMQELSKSLEGLLSISLFNDGSGKLNHMCGADFVKMEQKMPQSLPIEEGVRYVSFDGDADRIVYFYVEEGKFHLLDGDKIATLVAGYLMELVQESGLKLQLGLVQTAYANGNSTNYISKSLNVPVACVPTGVKFLHHKALEFDIGVYFEANGHGTVVFKETANHLIKSAALNQINTAAKTLNALMGVINQTVGDAVSDMLLVESILAAKGWSTKEWNATYKDLPSRQRKVVVKDRRLIGTTDAERKCVSPPGLQDRIDQLVQQYQNGRAFVRPSGTEDIVRVYAEAATQESCDDLAERVVQAVFELAGGVP